MSEMEIQENIIGNMPFLTPLLDFNPKNEFIYKSLMEIISNFDSMLISEAQFIEKFDRTEKKITKETQGTGLDDFIPFKDNIEISKMMFNIKKKQLEILIKHLISISESYEKLVDEKRQVIKVPIVEALTKEMQEEVENKYKDDIKFFYNNMKRHAIGIKKIKDIKNQFILDHAKTEHEKIIIERLMLQYENENYNKSKNKEEDKVPDMQ